jgi:translation initiation factor eIF-2B subunit epsilon
MPPANVKKGARAEEKLIAVVLGDSFDVHFRPITNFVPRTLMPLANIPILEYTLECLAAAYVDEIIVFCNHMGHMIKDYLSKSKWMSRQSGLPKVDVVISTTSQSAGDALREVYDMDIIRSDFVLVSGDIVSNLNLEAAIEKHRAAKEKDKNLMMTMVVRPRGQRSLPAHYGPQIDTEDLCIVMDPRTSQLIRYERLASGSRLRLPLSVFSDAVPEVDVRTDFLDCYVDICTPEMLSECKDNFDYRDLRRDFVETVLNDEVMNHHIYIHQASAQEYAQRVTSIPMYRAVTLDVLHRWTYPFVPDIVFKNPKTSYRFLRPCTYLDEKDVVLARSAVLGDAVMIGKGTSVGADTRLEQTVVGQKCLLGKDCLLSSCIIWDGVTIADNIELHDTIVCEGATVTNSNADSSRLVLRHKIITKDGMVEESDAVNIAKRPSNDSVGGSNRDAEEDDDAEGSETDSELSDDGQDEAPVFIPNEHHHLSLLIQTVRRAISEKISVHDVLHEVNGLKSAYDASFQACTKGILLAFFEDVLQTPPPTKSAADSLLRLKSLLAEYSELLTRYASDQTQQVAVIAHLEDAADETPLWSSLFQHIIKMLYDEDVLEEEAIIAWAEGSQQPSTPGGVPSANRSKYIKACDAFLTWLREAEEESEEEDDEDDEDDE